MLANALSSMGVNVEIFCLDRIGEGVDWLSNDIQVHVVGRRPGRAIDFGAVHRFRRMLHESRIDLVQSHNWSTLLECSIATRSPHRIPHVFAEHGGLIVSPDCSNLKNKARGLIARFALKLCDARVAIAERLREKLSFETGINKSAIDFFPNGISAPHYAHPSRDEARSSIRRELGLNAEALVIGTVARLHEVKRLDWAIRAFKESLVALPNGYLMIVGEGEERRTLEDLACNLNVQRRVLFVGEKEHVADWLAAMDLYVNTSRSEGMSISILEALACGLPVVATDVGDSRVLVGGEPEVGIVVPVGEVTAIAAGMVELGVDGRRRQQLGTNAVNRFLDNYSLETMSQRYMELYNRLLKGGEKKMIGKEGSQIR